jgi:N-acetylglutamate synthase-like GNAT family acetyltransferase
MASRDSSPGHEGGLGSAGSYDADSFAAGDYDGRLSESDPSDPSSPDWPSLVNFNLSQPSSSLLQNLSLDTSFSPSDPSLSSPSSFSSFDLNNLFDPSFSFDFEIPSPGPEFNNPYASDHGDGVGSTSSFSSSDLKNIEIPCLLCDAVAKGVLGANRPFCNDSCQETFSSLKDLIGKENVVETVAGDPSITTWKIMKVDNNIDHQELTTFEEATALLTSSFGYRKKEFVRRIAFSEGYFSGFCNFIVFKDGELASLATFRIHARNTKVVEIPYVATDPKFRCKGMCKMLMNSLEKCLSEVLGVKNLILPSLDDTLPMWEQRFGFHRITYQELQDLFEDHNINTILEFDGTTICHKVLTL